MQAHLILHWTHMSEGKFSCTTENLFEYALFLRWSIEELKVWEGGKTQNLRWLDIPPRDYYDRSVHLSKFVTWIFSTVFYPLHWKVSLILWCKLLLQFLFDFQETLLKYSAWWVVLYDEKPFFNAGLYALCTKVHLSSSYWVNVLWNYLPFTHCPFYVYKWS